jgi:hypothetical protein
MGVSLSGIILVAGIGLVVAVIMIIKNSKKT